MNKLIYGYDQTSGKNETLSDEENLVTKKMSPELSKKFKEYNAIGEKAFGWYTKFIYIGMYTFGITLIGSVVLSQIISSVNFSNERTVNILQILMYIFIVVCVISFLTLVLLVISLIRKAKSTEMQKLHNDMEVLYNQAVEELNIAATVTKLDVFATKYKIKRDKRIIKEFRNIDCLVWRDNDELHIWNQVEQISIPLDAFITIDSMKQKVKLYRWNKDEKPSREFCKDNGIKVVDRTEYQIKTIYTIKIIKDDTTYELLLPVYEIEPFMKLTGMNNIDI